ncbi:hypothetical protein NUW58_g7002 [Xylaria curta]|uniref:Uncharacterized protein n=1 Tax=Xylaria curta TaxID=42375 RepID=A0ACC1NNY8_9PEZI|nr:hypothetical protein NUW58_g7002 [Xylaria curta]
MRIIKPSWLSHKGEQKDFEVYSCHVSPDGKRLATAGGGTCPRPRTTVSSSSPDLKQTDGHVRIWSN